MQTNKYTQEDAEQHRSKENVLTTTSVTKMDTMTNKNSKNKPCNGIKAEQRKLMTEDQDKHRDHGSQYDK